MTAVGTVRTAVGRTALLVLALTVLSLRATAQAPGRGPQLADLGDNLHYARLRQLPEDLPPAGTIPAGPLVLDLRFTTAESDGGPRLADWLKSRAGDNTPVIILLNASTASSLEAVLSAPKLPAGAITLGPAGTNFVPDLAITVDPAADASAYQAWQPGRSLEDLIHPTIEKTRFDEAALAREKEAGAQATEPNSNDTGRGSAGTRAQAPEDLLLRRAVQLHRALLALGRIH